MLSSNPFALLRYDGLLRTELRSSETSGRRRVYGAFQRCEHNKKSTFSVRASRFAKSLADFKINKDTQSHRAAARCFNTDPKATPLLTSI